MSLVRVLGPVDVLGDDGVVRQSGSALRRTLLALLALHRGEVLSPDWLLEHVWGEEQPDSGVRALRFHVSQLRKDVGAVVSIETRPGGYRLDVPAASVDALVFEVLAREARIEVDDVLSSALCSEALGLWRGVPFVDAAGCSTLDNEAGRLDELRLTVVELFYVRRLAAGAGGELIADLSQLVNQHQLREGLWSSLIIALYRAGQQADAIRTYERLRATLAESLGLDPSPELQDLQMRVLRQDLDLTVANASAAGTVRAHNLPASATSFIEPSGGFDALTAMSAAHRLVTLTGSGGVGKTRMAVELGLRSLDGFHGGVRMVELAPVVEPEAVVAAFAFALSVTPQPGSTMLESVVDWCRGRHLLLIVDNCEHVIDTVSEVLATIVANCPTVTIIATSREALGLDGEWVHRVAELDRPAAVELFTQRASAADSSFVLDDADHETVGRLCERLDGVPLAIELAAARVRSMSPSELLEHLDDRFRLLRGTARSRHDRHLTLRAAVAWSYQLLTDAERVVLERASVFAGSFDLAAAKAVCSGDMIDRADVMELLAGLVDKSIVVAERRATEMRYRLLETLREYGEEQLVAHADGHGPHDRHLRHYVGLAEHTDRVFRGPREVEAGQIFDIEWDNLRAAHAWSISTQDLDQAERLLTATFAYASSRARSETADWIERTLTIQTDHRQPDPHTYGMAASWAHMAQLDELQYRWAQRGIDTAPSPDHPSTALCWSLKYYDETELPEFHTLGPVNRLETAVVGLDLDHDWWALVMLAGVATPTPRLRDQRGRQAEEQKRGYVARLIEIADRVGSPSLQANAALQRGDELIDGVPADAKHALEWYNRALKIAREAHNVHFEGECIRAVALATTDLAADECAAEACRSALAQLHDTANWHDLVKTMESAALVLATLGHLEQASITLGRLGASPWPYTREISFGFRQRTLELVHRDDRAEHWMTLGATMDRDHVVTQTIEHLATAAARALPT